MSAIEVAAVALLALFGVVTAIRLAAAPLRLALRLLGNTALGFAALWLVQQTAAFTGITLGLNLFNACTIGILGLPGLGLLAALQWVLT